MTDTLITKAVVLDAALSGGGCLGRAAEDEPVFVLRAADVTFMRVLEYWRAEAEVEGVSADKLSGAQRVQAAAARWRQQHTVKVPD